MRGLLNLIIAIVFVFALAFGAAASAASAHAAPPPARVVIIVGPVGSLTDRYRAYGAAEAREAARWASDIQLISSPNATWPAVRRALQGATLVVYLGHGNGFPSPYRSEPYPRTQNGLGLNPVAGVDDDAHQYFGESFIARDVRLAPGAIVILSHLCYASGNAEPGGPEPSRDVALARADNYAAGWLAAGAGAVVADAFAPPGEYIKTLLSTRASIGTLWSSATTRHGHAVSAPSARTVGATVFLDPTTPDSGFYRSLVRQAGGSTGVGPAAGGAAAGQAISAPEPAAASLAALGIRVGVPSLTEIAAGAGLIAGGSAELGLPLTRAGSSGPPPLRLAVRWEPLDPRPLAIDPAAVSALPSAPPATPSPTLTPPVPMSFPPPTEAPSLEPPPTDLVVAEEPASVVESVPAAIDGRGLRLAITLPQEPGRYRLTLTVHDADDVAFDAASQALISSLVVRVSAPTSVAYGVDGSVAVVADSGFALPIRIANSGNRPWARTTVPSIGVVDEGPLDAAPTLVVHWIALDRATTAPASVALAVPSLDPGESAVVAVRLLAPASPGAYVLMIDLDTPIDGSLAAAGVPMATVRVTVLGTLPPAPVGQLRHVSLQ